MKKRITLVTVMMLVSALILTGCGQQKTPDTSKSAGSTEQAAPDAQPVNLKMATLDVGSSWYTTGVALADNINKQLPTGSGVDVLPYSGSIGNVKLVQNGEADMGLTGSGIGNWAYNGKLAFDNKLSGLRVLVAGIDQYYFLPIVRADFPINSLQEIKDKKLKVNIVTQPKGSVGEFGGRLMLEAYGITPADIQAWGGKYTNTSTEVISSDMKDGRAQILIQNVVKNHPTVTDISLSTPIKFLPLEDNIIKDLSEKYGLPPVTMPAGSFKGQDKPINAIGLPTMLVASDKMSDEVAYAVTKAICENADSLKKNVGAMSGFDPAKTLNLNGGVPFHPGAIKYYKEKGWMK